MLVMATMQTNQLRSNNFLEFQMKRTQLQAAIVGQVLGDPNNCACLFRGAAPFPANPNPAGPGATLTGVNPTEIGQYTFVGTPPNCATATLPQPLINNTGIDDMRSTLIQLTNIKRVSPGIYSGNFVVILESLKSVLGPSTLEIRIPVSIGASPAGPNVAFQSCSMTAPSSITKIPFTATCRGFRSCHVQALSVCQAAFGTESCAESVSCTQADGGDQDIEVMGYTCRAGLCVDGRRGRFHNLSGDNCGSKCNVPPGYTPVGVLNCSPGDVPHTL